MQEVVELVVFALIALLVGTGVVWLAGWLLGLVGTVLTWLAGLVWSLLRFLVPIAVVAGAVYLLVKLMNRSAEKVAREPQAQPATPPSPQTRAREEAAARAAAGETSAPPQDAGSEPSTPVEPAPDEPAPDGSVPDGSVPKASKPPATNRWEGEGGSLTSGEELGDEPGDEPGESGDGRDRRDGDSEDDERRHGGGGS